MWSFSICAGIALASCTQKNTLFRSLAPSRTGVDFVNTLTEDDKYNVLEYMNIYTGAGVAAGDVNNDGLTDLYFSGNQAGGRLYINKGGLRFEDVSKKSGFIQGRWETGVSMTDINQDGWLDIYVNVAGSEKFGPLENLLYVNNRDGTFTEQAKAYGIADKRLTMNSSFFDYDRDGDLDLFLITNPADEMVSGINRLNDRMIDGESAGTDILYRNNGHGTFTDVSREAGILIEGYSLGAAISDVNSDGWPDIYVSNDFMSNDILYINNRNGSFSDQTSAYLKHTSFASMGNDVADFNNDALPDLYVLDMLPEDNFRKKMIIPAASYDKFKLSLAKGYEPQYTRNTLQLNNGNGTFSDISFLAGVSSTDWSWSSLWADFDNDGDKDLMVTNGFYRDLGNLDYIHYQARLQNPMGRQDAKRQEKLKAIEALKGHPLQNYIFENNGNLRFSKRTNDWGITEKGFSNGACYADLDNDGDLELVINRLNSAALIYENTSNAAAHFLKIKLKGRSPNLQGIGSKVWLYCGRQMQFQEFNPSRGFESSMEPVLHFGMGKNTKVDSVIVAWPDGSRSMQADVPANQSMIIDQAGAKEPAIVSEILDSTAANPIKEVSRSLGLDYVHTENEYTDFKVQPLLPHMHSQNGPGIAVGDVNGDQLEDFYIGGASGSGGAFFVQNEKGKFRKQPLLLDTICEDMGSLLFDADGDGDNDLYIASGGSEHPDGSMAQQDRLYLNDGKGLFRLATNALPDTRASGSCVVASDFDRDGDLDLFIGGRVTPGKYPMPCRSYLLRNDGSGDRARFTDITETAAAPLSRIGMVSSALWTDFDNDNQPDLIVTGEFMTIRFFKNNHGVFTDVTTATGLEHLSGWWNSMAAADFDQDGDIDYVAGNLGLNSRHQASATQPLCIYAKDFDKNGLIDPVMCYYVQGKNYIYPSRDELVKQVNPMRRRFNTYESFASATFEESFLPDELAGAYIVKAERFESSYLENLGNGKFKAMALPVVAQFGPIFGMLTGDYNGDGFTDVLVTGNSYATEASTGRYDAMKGMLLAGDGKGKFTEDKKDCAGFKADGDVKGLAEINLNNGQRLVLVANNDAAMEAYRWPTQLAEAVPIKKEDAYAIVHLQSGRLEKHEFYFGNNYLSQSSRSLQKGKNIVSFDIYDRNGNKRSIPVQP